MSGRRHSNALCFSPEFYCLARIILQYSIQITDSRLKLCGVVTSCSTYLAWMTISNKNETHRRYWVTATATHTIHTISHSSNNNIITDCLFVWIRLWVISEIKSRTFMSLNRAKASLLLAAIALIGIFQNKKTTTKIVFLFMLNVRCKVHCVNEYGFKHYASVDYWMFTRSIPSNFQHTHSHQHPDLEK